MIQYFEFQEENVPCFWEIMLEDKIIRTRYGQKGTAGVVMEEVFEDAGTAAREYKRLVQEKKKDDSFYFRLGDDYRL
ncbi:WGR domain-containing protein [Chitinophaga tropicalis]|uniref:WGR domain-containing protein n=1 Tax=Chitinophaga tropicalis TaxID=2683588 RepID=A0A7K1UCT1_9BACT|nr:WGR domain-containing protein [Chitinophaga tropicalis]MVT12078.1 WGR domain-containing protein [Chitinophaga tropicalis]